MKKTLLIAAAALIAQTSFAQISIAPEVGFQMVNQNVNSDSSTSGDFKASYRAGVNLGVDLSKKLTLHVGGFYSAKGTQQDVFGIKAKANYNYIEVPIYLNYSVVKFGGNELFVGAGPYLAYCIGAKAKIEGSIFGQSIDEEIDMPVGSDENTDAVKPLDLGVNANIGFITKMGIYARAHYSLGLANTVPGGDSDNSIKNTAFGLSVGYQIKF
jgi:hypothetical protein